MRFTYKNQINFLFSQDRIPLDYSKCSEYRAKIFIKSYDLFYLLDVTGDDCISALSSDMKDYEDAVVSCYSDRNQMQYIVTRNIRDYQNSKVKAILPDDFLNLITGNEAEDTSVPV